MFVNSVKTGLKKGMETTWTLAKIIIPVYFVVTLLKHSPVLGWVADVFGPVMAIFNLPGEAAIVLVLGNFLNIYAALGAISAISLTPLEITTISLMLSFSHSLLIETAVANKLKISTLQVIFIRVGLALAVGIIMGRLGGIL